jgi:hypothetical protein
VILLVGIFATRNILQLLLLTTLFLARTTDHGYIHCTWILFPPDASMPKRKASEAALPADATEATDSGSKKQKSSEEPGPAPKPSGFNAFAALMPKESWVCVSCSLANTDMSLKECAACEAPRPGFEAEVCERERVCVCVCVC